MLIGICGGICAGKTSVQDYLISQHNFKPLKLQRTSSTPAIEKSASEANVPAPDETIADTFANVSDLLDFATKNWQSNYVTTSIHDETIVDKLSGRPFFILVHIDAPISIRWQRFKDRCARTSLTPPTLEQFVLRNDAHQYSASTGLAALASRAQVKLLNSTSSLEKLHFALNSLNLTDSSRMRPTWDHYFMTLASLAARRSNCMRRQVGCVLVREKRVMATGYNGTPRNVTNCSEGGCPRCNSGNAGGHSLSTCLCIHAEENALLEAGRERVGGGAVLYCNTCPCLTCSIKIVQVGITEVVFNQTYYMDSEAAKIFKEAGVKLRQFSPPKEGLVNLLDDMAVSEDGNAASKSLANGTTAINGTGGKHALVSAQSRRSQAKAKVDGPTGDIADVHDPKLRALLAKVNELANKPYLPQTQATLDEECARRARATAGLHGPGTVSVAGGPSAWSRGQHHHVDMVDLTDTDASPASLTALTTRQAQQGAPVPPQRPNAGNGWHIEARIDITQDSSNAIRSVHQDEPRTAQRPALMENRAAVNNVVAKRPAPQALQATATKRPRHQPQGRVVDMQRPLSNVSKNAKVYNAIVEARREYSWQGSRSVAELVRTLTLDRMYVEPACQELKELGLLVQPVSYSDRYTAVPFDRWREQQEDLSNGVY